MQTAIEAPRTSQKTVWSGWVLTGLSLAFLLLDAIMKIVRASPAVKGTVELGYPDASVVGIGITLLIATVVYAIPRTAVLGAILLTGYLGGAIATNVRVAAPLFSHVLFPVYIAVLVWGGLWLRDARLRQMIS